MIESIKYKLMSGEFGVTRKGYKCRYIGKNHNGKHTWAIYDMVTHTRFSFIDFEEFECRLGIRVPDSLDVIGLWSDKPEPFSYQKAIEGYPCVTEGGDKIYIIADVSNLTDNEACLIGYDNKSIGFIYKFTKDGQCVGMSGDPSFNIIGMWKEKEK